MKPHFSILHSSFFILALALALLTGCQSYEIVQRNVFADDDGNIVTVDYGRSDTDHVNEFVSPVTGATMEFKSKLVVKATLPDGDTIKAWQTMNFQRHGTMYKTDNEKWMVLVNGFTLMIYRRDEKNPGRYAEVFRGVLCDSPKLDVEKDDRWRTLKPNERARKY